MREIPSTCPIQEFCKGYKDSPDDAFIVSHLNILMKGEETGAMISLCMAEAILSEEKECPMEIIFNKAREKELVTEIFGRDNLPQVLERFFHFKD
ncbi:MAG: hypothetical protein CEO21_411 [Microgenomates group bacterium Gr01-1014_80]|nr:MAG: hypothetical protein CEO21_411 [Microgenomates group bacterium Gr01-1014_80]